MFTPKKNTARSRAKMQEFYNNKKVVIFLCIVYCPVGIYCLWRSQSFSLVKKITITAIVSSIVIFILYLNNQSKRTATSSNPIKTTTTTQKSL